MSNTPERGDLLTFLRLKAEATGGLFADYVYLAGIVFRSVRTTRVGACPSTPTSARTM
jgi:hypothetical protein